MQLLILKHIPNNEKHAKNVDIFFLSSHIGTTLKKSILFLLRKQHILTGKGDLSGKR